MTATVTSDAADTQSERRPAIHGGPTLSNVLLLAAFVLGVSGLLGLLLSLLTT